MSVNAEGSFLAFSPWSLISTVGLKQFLHFGVLQVLEEFSLAIVVDST